MRSETRSSEKRQEILRFFGVDPYLIITFCINEPKLVELINCLKIFKKDVPFFSKLYLFSVAKYRIIECRI